MHLKGEKIHVFKNSFRTQSCSFYHIVCAQAFGESNIKKFILLIFPCSSYINKVTVYMLAKAAGGKF